MQLKMTNNNSIILVCWTEKWDKKKRNFEEKHLHLYIEDDHLFIIDNAWNSLQIKKIDYSNFLPMRPFREKLKQATLKAKPEEFDGICIDLNANRECKSLRDRRQKRKSHEKQ